MNKKGLTLVFSTALISGLAIYLNKFSVSVINPYVFAFLKNLVVGVFLITVIMAFKRWKNIRFLRKKDFVKLILIGLIGGSIPFLLFFKGLALTSAAKGAFIHKTMFIYVAILATIFLKEKINKKLFFAIIALLLGTYLLIKLTPSALNMGDLMIFFAVLFWAAEQILSKHTLKNLSGLTVAWGRMFFGSIFLLIFLGFTGQLTYVSELTSNQILWTLFTAFLLVLYVLTWYSGIKLIPINVATCVLALGAPITTLLALIFEHQLLTLSQVFGIFLIALGVFLAIDIKKIIHSSKEKLYESPRT